MDEITKQQERCSRCGGSGIQFKPAAYKFFAEWRKMLRLTQPQVVSAVGLVDKHQLSNFEHGKYKFGEGRLRDLAQYYTETGEQLRATGRPKKEQVERLEREKEKE